METNFARRSGLRVAVQGTGHTAAPLGFLAGTVLIKTHDMRDVSVDPLPEPYGPGPARCGETSPQPPAIGWPGWPRPHPTSAWSVTVRAAR
jgi:hypothetical protein